MARGKNQCNSISIGEAISAQVSDFERKREIDLEFRNYTCIFRKNDSQRLLKVIFPRTVNYSVHRKFDAFVFKTNADARVSKSALLFHD